MRLPADLMTGKPSFLPSTNAIANLQDRMRLVHEVIKTRLKRRNLLKERYDQKASANTAYSVGDFVMLRNFVLQTDESCKFYLPYCGPYRVDEVLPPVNYVIESLDGSTTDESRKFHLPYCGPYRVDEVLPPVNYVIESLDGSTTDESRKFHLPYCGPYRVVEVLPPVNYVIESLDGSTTKRVHFNRLKKSCGRINEKSTTEDDKLKESSCNDWPNSDVGFYRRFSQSQSQLSRSHNINNRRPNLRPRSTLRSPHYYSDVWLHFDCLTALYEIVLHLGNFDIIESHHHELICCRLFVILCIRIFLVISFCFSAGGR